MNQNKNNFISNNMLTFQEIGGSPTEEYSLDGFSARRTFLVPWQDRNEFVRILLKGGEEEKRLKYPDHDDVYIYRVRLEPLDSNAINVQEQNDLSEDVARYETSFARIIVDYRTEEETDRKDVPLLEDGTSLSYRMLVESKKEKLPVGFRWRWPGTEILLPEDMVLSKWTPQTLHILTWSNVVDPPWEKISALQGTVNETTFLGCLPATLLFEGAEANKLYRTNKESGSLEESNFVWSIKYTFREQAIKIGGEIFGWNHVYDEATARWLIPYRHSRDKLYELKDFNLLFHSDTSSIRIPG